MKAEPKMSVTMLTRSRDETVKAAIKDPFDE
jgi:hypothetical protein